MAKSSVIYIHHSTFRMCVCNSLRHVPSKILFSFKQYYSISVDTLIHSFYLTFHESTSNILLGPRHSATKLRADTLKMQKLLKRKHNLCESYQINTLMVSKGCPATTVHTPPNPPDKKYFTGFTDFFSDMFNELFSTATRYGTPTHTAE